MTGRRRLLFLCTGNSCRSQMAEGWARELLDEEVEAHSAGVDPARLDPRAVEVMREVGVDIAGQRAKPVSELSGLSFDLVVTVCDHASETCPRFPGSTEVIHQSFDDPPRLAAGASSEIDALGHYRRVRDEIRAFIESCSRLVQVDEPEGTTREVSRS